MNPLKRTTLLLLPLLMLSACGGGSSDTGGGQGPDPDPNPDPNPIVAQCSKAEDRFNSNGASTVPPGCTKVQIEAVGGGGGGGGSIEALNDDSAQPGKRARVDLVERTVTPGEVLDITVGKGGGSGVVGRGLDGGPGGQGGAGDGNGSAGTRGKNGIAVVLPFGAGGGGGGGGASSVRRQDGERIAHAPGGDGGNGADCGLLCAAEGEGGAGAPASGSRVNNTSFGGGGKIFIRLSGGRGVDGAVILRYSD